MKRTLAIALTAVALVLGGCSRPSSPAAAPSEHSAPSTARVAATSPAPAASSSGDVRDLLNQVDKQLNSNDQPSSEQD